MSYHHVIRATRVLPVLIHMHWGQGVTRAKAVPAQNECFIGRLLMNFYLMIKSEFSGTCNFGFHSDHTKREYLSTGSEAAMATYKERISSGGSVILTGS